MAKVPTMRSRDQTQDFQGLLNNLQDWELSIKEKGKKLKSDAAGKSNSINHPSQTSGNVASQNRVNGQGMTQRNFSSVNTSTARQFDYLKEYEALSQLSSGVSSEDNFVDANSEKELGNEYFKQKKFNEAIDCYSRSIALSPTAVAYANRAMAYIKIKRFQEAENDCSEALNLDDRYIKAYSRRSTARKELRKFKESLDDAEFALKLDPQNQELKKQFAESKSLIEKEVLRKASGALAEKNKHVQTPQSVSMGSARKMATIVEDDTKGNKIAEAAAATSMETERNHTRINDSDAVVSSNMAKGKAKTSKQELRASVLELAAKAANLAKAEAAKNIAPPNSAYQFEVTWRGLADDRELQARFLKVTPPSALPGIFKNALSAPILVDIIKCIATFFRIPRFDTIIMCLSSADKADISMIWNETISKTSADYSDIISNLRPKYGINP
ncbi:uncharacterized protein LOC127254694 isoform X2 [Andrographis paniculata]|uniref:uncharacterized protein LOC127254694 isoform X2 n=1 Tax=Andrographis paniculata TaxID=175694 RepID=UPI0021E761C7|nr:uncharacterized protein LOC127254694 isoform X2 [Andrographis paniculata]